ncbi:MAG: ATP-binding protein [Magnetospirillum sp. WYHS-4]
MKFLALGGGLAAVALGAVVLVGWHAGIPVLVQVAPALVPMQYNTALAFLLCGAGLLALVMGRHGWAALGGGAGGGLLGLLTLVEYGTGAEIGIDQIFMTHDITVATSHPGRMAPNTALCFALSGLALIAGNIRHLGIRWGVLGIIGAIVSGLGLVALSGYALSLPTAYGWGRLTQMALHTSVGFILLGIGLTAAAWREECRNSQLPPTWLPSVVWSGAATLALALWQALHVMGTGAWGTSLALPADDLVLLFGLIMATVLAFAISALRKAQASAEEAKWAERHRAESEARFRSYFEIGLVGLAETSLEKGWVRVNENLCRMLGYERSELTELTWAQLTHPDDLAADVAQFARILAGEIDGYSMEKRFLRKDGQVVHTIMSVQVQRKADGSPDFFVAVLQDISARKALEESLTRSNAELEQFAYIASHDLQEPLRNVSNYVQLIDRRYRDRLDEEGREFLEIATGSAKRASALIHDLLLFSRVASQGGEIMATDGMGVLETVLLDMDAAIRESGARLIVEQSLPWVQVAPRQFAQLLQNLIGNAIKYRAPDRVPEVRLSARRQGADWRISVADNGIGIAPEYFERIFLIFKRLHTQDVYEGTGIGLAICKRIAERHGGRIWVESEPDKGSVFHFTVPAAESPSVSAA